MKNTIIALLLLVGISANAMVDMKNANYAESWTDIIVPGTGYDLKITRTYNSRSLFSGMFGFGWCSDFETKIDIMPEGTLKLTECGAGQEVLFTPQQYGKKDVDSTINKIAAKMRSAKKIDESTIKNLSERMLSDADLRAQYAKEYGISFSIVEGTQYFANGKEVENIVYKNKQYVRNLPDGSNQVFDAVTGYMMHMSDKNGNFLKLAYDKDTLRDITDNNGRKLSFKFYPNKKVKAISGPNNSNAEYKYSNLDDLAWVKNMWNNEYKHEYDDLHNLTKNIWPDGTFSALTYDKKKDWVLSFVDRNKCVESYRYEDGKDDPQNHYLSFAKKVCDKEVIADNKYEFWFKKRPTDGSDYLSRILTVTNGLSVDITYHEIFGKPLTITRNNEKISFEYYADGLVKTKASTYMNQSFEYDKTNKKVNKVTTTFLGEKGKKLATKSASFKYDGKGNLSYAENTDGQKVTMTYDHKGRIATLTDQAKKVVKIEYEERFGKPAVVTRVGLGTIKFTYKANGEMDKIDDGKDPITAMQVASTFNNLLDVIAPATAEIFN